MGDEVCFINEEICGLSQNHRQTLYSPGPRGYKTFFMLNSGEHEIFDAHKYKNIKKSNFFLGSGKPRMLFFLLINVKMPTIVGILTFMSRKNFMLT